MYGLAGAAGAARGRANGTTAGIQDVAVAAAGAIHGRMEKAKKVKEGDEYVKSMVDSGLIGPEEATYLTGISHGGGGVDHIAVAAQHLMATKQAQKVNAAKMDIQNQKASIEHDKAYGYDEQGNVPMDAQGNEVPGPPAPVHHPGSIDVNAQRGGAYSENIDSQVQRRTDQTAQADSRNAMHESLGTRRADIAQQNADANTARANRPTGKQPPTQEDTNFEQTKQHLSDLNRYASQMRGIWTATMADAGAKPADKDAAFKQYMEAQNAAADAADQHLGSIKKRDDAKRKGGTKAAPTSDGFDYQSIPSGSEYTDPNGVRRRKQ